MRIGLLGGLTVEHDGLQVPVSGAMQLAVLFRLAVDTGSAVSYRAIAEDVWTDAPENERAALQSIISRLRSQLPAGTIESTAGGYRLTVAREHVDALAFADLVALALVAEGDERARLASEALALWAGEPWVPSDDFDWFERDLRRDRATALELGGVAAAQHRPSAIPAPLTDLVGRQHELESVAEQLTASRLVTIVGVGGAGKTRLAIETASGIPGSVLVELAPVGPDEIFAAILAATGRELRTAGETTSLAGSRERVLEALIGRPVLLVLDNCEHVIDEVALDTEWLLGALPQLRVLATSREPLTIPGEAFVTVGPLPHPAETDLLSATSADLLDFDAVELFHQRATAARGSALDETELAVAARICIRLDGLPLALELAAAKLRTMTPAEVLEGLEDRFALLTGGFRTALPRHRTLRAMIDWSWSLLSDGERRALAWIAVFPAGIDAADAARIARALGLSSAAVFDSLVDRSLLQRSRGRFRALETIREYGIERLAEREELASARQIQADVMADRAVEFDRMVRGARILDAISWFDAEDDNIAAALRYATRAVLPDLAVRLVVACGWYWIIRGREEDARNWFEQVAPLAESVDSDEARMLTILTPMIRMADAAEGGDQAVREKISGEMSARASGVPAVGRGGHELLQLLTPLVQAFTSAGDDPASMMLHLKLPTGEDLGLDPWPTALLHVMRAAMAQNRGEVDLLGDESLIAVEQFSVIGDVWGLALSQQMRAEWLVLNGRLSEALEISDEATENFRRITPSWDLVNQQGLAISIFIRQGRFDEARVRVAQLLDQAERSSNARAELQAQVTALTASVSLGDVTEGVQRLARVDTVSDAWPNLPLQLKAGIEAARGGLHLLRGDRDAAENAMHRAVDAALASHDYPIIGMVALGLGSLAMDRGDLREALRAVDLASAIIGIRDETSPQLVAIERAAAAAAMERAGAEAPTRSMALEDLAQILRR